jgi:hypothetical protein
MSQEDWYTVFGRRQEHLFHGKRQEDRHKKGKYFQTGALFMEAGRRYAQLCNTKQLMENLPIFY